MKTSSIELEKFISLDFPGRVLYVYGLYGKRFWSHQLADIWRTILQAVEDPVDRLSIIRQLIQLAPESNESEADFRLLFSQNDALSTGERVHIIISCEKYRDRSQSLLSALLPRLRLVFVVIGQPKLQAAEFNGNYLYVPAPDNYEHLTSKVLEALVAVRQRFGNVGVIKIDDDVGVIDSYDLDRLTAALNNVDYGGHPVGGPGFDRCWHIGKCENKKVPIYTKRYVGAWARGPLYYLSPKAVETVLREYVFCPSEITQGVYDAGLEDKLIGDLLRKHKIALDAVDLGSFLGLSLSDEEPPTLDSITLDS